MRIVITGGPCAGKTSALKVLRSRLASEGVSAVFVPEAATDLILEGIAPWTCDSMLEFQKRVMGLQLQREREAFGQAAGPESEGLVVCDRGLRDSRAYLSDADYECALAANGLDGCDLLSRYDAVFHLNTIAKDNPSAYTRANNSARFETPEEAIAADARTLAAWSGHPRLSVIGNEASFERKAENLVSQILALARGC